MEVEDMRTVWNGTQLDLVFENGDTHILNSAQTKEFEAWVKSRVVKVWWGVEDEDSTKHRF
jgi:hypothetical protein